MEHSYELGREAVEFVNESDETSLENPFIFFKQRAETLVTTANIGYLRVQSSSNPLIFKTLCRS
jgi:hypothetical protein